MHSALKPTIPHDNCFYRIATTILLLQGVTVTNLRPDQLEHEVLLFWAAVMPVVGNPVIYLFCVTEYRQNILAVWRSCTQGNTSYW